MKKFVSLALALAMMLALVSCAAGDTTSSAAPSANAGDSAGGDVKMPGFITVGTGATGAAFYPIGVSMADILTNNFKTQATAQVTGGALENLQLVQEGTIDLGITMGNSAQAAYEGTGDYEGTAYTNVNALFGGLSKGYFQVVVLENSPIQTMKDLVGKKVCMGPAGNGAISVAATIWNAYGFGVDDVNATYLAYDDGISQLTDGNCDAVVVQAAVPSSAIQELAASGKGYRFIPVEQEIADKLCADYQYFGYDTLKSTVYDNNPVDTQTMVITNMVIVRADMDEGVVYEMTKAMFENLDKIKESHKAASGLSLEGAVRTSIPLHPGAERYFKEIGAI